jgi:hypothetical protein
MAYYIFLKSLRSLEEFWKNRHDKISLVVISWHTPWKFVRVLIGTMSIRLSEDNHDSWVTCTTSAECKIVVTTGLMVMSGMDPHMIRWNLRWVWFGLVGWLKWISLGCGSVTV